MVRVVIFSPEMIMACAVPIIRYRPLCCIKFTLDGIIWYCDANGYSGKSIPAKWYIKCCSVGASIINGTCQYLFFKSTRVKSVALIANHKCHQEFYRNMVIFTLPCWGCLGQGKFWGLFLPSLPYDLTITQLGMHRVTLFSFNITPFCFICVICFLNVSCLWKGMDWHGINLGYMVGSRLMCYGSPGNVPRPLNISTLWFRFPLSFWCCVINEQWLTQWHGQLACRYRNHLLGLLVSCCLLCVIKLM